MIRHFATILAACSIVGHAQAFETKAYAAYIVDQTTDTVLLNKNADVPLPPASMSKLMTLYMAFEAVRRGKAEGGLDLDEELPVSAHAQSFGGSSMFLVEGETIRVEDLLRGIIVLSGNDACVVIAEALSPDGTEYGFARMMTERARELGMVNSTFLNSSGWPATGHVQSMRDLAILADRLITDFPEFYPMFAETEYAFDNRVPSNRWNRNPVLTMGIGGDGLKTGHTQEAGFGLVGSAKQGDRRVIWVVTGLDTSEERATESQSIVNWAFRQFTLRKLADEGQQFAEARVWMGSEPSVGLIAGKELQVLMPALAVGDIEAEVVYQGPIEAPIARGDVLAELVFTPEGLPEKRLPLVADRDIAAGGFVSRITTAARVLVTQLMTSSDAPS